MPDTKTQYRIFVAVTPGLEALLVEELAELGYTRKVRKLVGGAELSVDRSGLWKLVSTSRLAESVRVRVGRFKAHNFEELADGLRRCPWAAYLDGSVVPDVRVVAKRSALYHTGAVRDRVEGVLREILAVPEGVGAPTPVPVVHLRIVKDGVTVSVDAAGERLHRRGYRSHVGKAPMRETLAAAVVRAAGLPERAVVWDPFCGSGTLVIEALCEAVGQAFSLPREYAFERWPTHDAVAYASFLERLPRLREPRRRGIGSDVDPAETSAARHNADLAGVGDAVQLVTADFERAAERIPRGSAVLSNLPYGRRSRGSQSLDKLFGRFGRLLRRRADLGPVVVLSGSSRFVGDSGLRWLRLHRFENRGLPVEILKLDRP